MESGSFKDFEEVRIIATSNMEIGSRSIAKGETIVFFDKIQIAGLSETRDFVSANGGFDNRARVVWETTRELPLNFSQGTFSKQQFALMANSRMIDLPQNTAIYTPAREYLESNEQGIIELKNIPQRNLYVYNMNTGEKVQHTQDGKYLTIADQYLNVIVDYEYDYTNRIQVIQLGNKLFKGTCILEGITRVKDETTGQIITGILYVPKLMITSNLAIRLGSRANPVVGNFSATGYPVGSHERSYVAEFYYLSDDIQADL